MLRGKPLLLVGDSIARDLAEFLVDTFGLDVYAITKSGAVPSDIGKEVNKNLKSSDHVISHCGLLIVCAGKNVLATAAIPAEVERHLLKPLAHHLPLDTVSICVGPVSRSQLAESQVPTRKRRRQPLLNELNETLELASTIHAFKFVNLVDTVPENALCDDDFVDPLHLNDIGQWKLARALLSKWKESAPCV